MKTPLRRFSTGLVFSLAFVFLCGCSGGQTKKRPPLGKVNGKVVYQGKPVAGAAVTFILDSSPRASTGTTNDKGEFQLTTFDTDDGAPIGTHKVTISQFVVDPNVRPMTVADLAAKGPPPPPKGGFIPSKYADQKTTPQKNTVDAGKNEITIELKD